METFLPVSVKFHIHLTVLQSLTGFFSHNFWFMSESWWSCPSMSKRALPGVFYSKTFSKETIRSQHSQEFRKMEVHTSKYAGQCVCVCVCVQGKPFTLSELPSFETPEANLCGQFLKVFLKNFFWKFCHGNIVSSCVCWWPVWYV